MVTVTVTVEPSAGKSSAHQHTPPVTETNTSHIRLKFSKKWLWAGSIPFMDTKTIDERKVQITGPGIVAMAFSVTLHSAKVLPLVIVVQGVVK